MDYTTRLTRFCSWKVPSRFDVQKMAKAGLTYASNRVFPDQVYCSFCNVYFRKWKSVEKPKDIHENYSQAVHF